MESSIPASWENAFVLGKSRGPEFSSFTHVSQQTFFGFHRLAINGLNVASHQPIRYNNMSLICNGEIYNYQTLYDEMNITPNTQSDCEIILHLYERYGMKQTLHLLDGVFAFSLCDYRNPDEIQCYHARDPYGVRPLYYMLSTQKTDRILYATASEIKVLHKLGQRPDTIRWFTPGTYTQMKLIKSRQLWSFVEINRSYSELPFIRSLTYSDSDREIALTQIREIFINAVSKRVLTTDRPIACLLSGGLDSSLVAALVQRILGPNKQVETYSIGLEGSEDLARAQEVADYIGSNHKSVVVDELTFLNAIPEVVRITETYDTTTIRASVGNYLVSKYILANSDAKVIFNGDGADELMGGYLYFHSCPDAYEFDKECRRLMKSIYRYDVLRSDKCISSNGLEPRTPFLDRGWVQYYLGLPPALRFHPGDGKMEKNLIREAFSVDLVHSSSTTNEPASRPILPEHILWRTKEAFSDGVSVQTRSWHEIIQEHVCLIDNLANIRVPSYLRTHGQTIGDEQKYYYSLFYSYYPGCGSLLTDYWMPRYLDTNDASARTLTTYSVHQNNTGKSVAACVEDVVPIHPITIVSTDEDAHKEDIEELTEGCMI